jgi:DoxX-like family
MDMSKRNKIIYWAATAWLSLGMLSTAIVQIIQTEEESAMMTRLGYPTYFMPVIGVLKILGVIAVLIPGRPLVKEWAYAGFVFTMTGALASHVITGDEVKTFFGPLLLLVLTIVSWYFRPVSRKTILLNP